MLCDQVCDGCASLSILHRARWVSVAINIRYRLIYHHGMSFIWRLQYQVSIDSEPGSLYGPNAAQDWRTICDWYCHEDKSGLDSAVCADEDALL